MSENAVRYQVRDSQGNVYGPADAATLRQWVQEGRIIAGMHIASEADGLWVEVTAHPALADLFGGGAPAPAAGPAEVTGASTGTVQAAEAAPVRPVTQLPGTPAAMAPMPGYPMAYASDRPRQNVLAVLSLTAGCVAALGLPLTCVPICGCIGVPLSGLMALTAIVLGAIGLHQIKAEAPSYTGHGLAVAGLCLGIGVIVLGIVGLIGAAVMGVLHK